MYTYPGWKTLDSETAKSANDTLAHENVAFIGFGACKYKEVTAEDYDAAETSEDLIALITSTLRTQCIEREIQFYDNLVNLGVLTLNPDKTFDIPFDNEFM